MTKDKEIKRLYELIHRYRICFMCGKQLSVREVESVHSCYDEQALTIETDHEDKNKTNNKTQEQKT